MGRTRSNTDSLKAKSKQSEKDDTILAEQTDVETESTWDLQDVGSQTQNRFEARNLFTRLQEYLKSKLIVGSPTFEL